MKRSVASIGLTLATLIAVCIGVKIAAFLSGNSLLTVDYVVLGMLTIIVKQAYSIEKILTDQIGKQTSDSTFNDSPKATRYRNKSTLN